MESQDFYEDLWDFGPDVSSENLLPLPQIWDKIAGTNPEYLANIINENGKASTYALHNKTIEFRQHGGTTNPEEVNQWVKFCVKFVQLAMYYGDHGGCPIIEWHQHEMINWRWLCEQMGLTQTEIRYWDAQVKGYENYPEDGLMRPSVDPDIRKFWPTGRKDEFGNYISEVKVSPWRYPSDHESEELGSGTEEEEGKNNNEDHDEILTNGVAATEDDDEEELSFETAQSHISPPEKPKSPLTPKRDASKLEPNISPPAIKRKVQFVKKVAVRTIPSRAVPARPITESRFANLYKRLPVTPTTGRSLLSQIQALYDDSQSLLDAIIDQTGKPAPTSEQLNDLESMITKTEFWLYLYSSHIRSRNASVRNRWSDKSEGSSSTMKRFEALVKLSKDVRGGTNYLRKTGRDSIFSQEGATNIFIFLRYWIAKFERREGWS